MLDLDPIQPDTVPVTIRAAEQSDETAVRCLEELEGRMLDPGPALVAETPDGIVAALCLETGAVVADPFRPTAHAVDLLRRDAGCDGRGGRCETSTHDCRAARRRGARIAALVGAAIAVVVAAGAGWAAIPSANGTISACKDNKGALKVIDAEAGQACASNQQLLQWSTLAGAGGVGGLQQVSASSSSSSSTWRAFSVDCPAGTKVVGGGADTGHFVSGSYLPQGGVAISQSMPLGDDAWGAVAQEIVPTSSSWSLSVRAVCAAA